MAPTPSEWGDTFKSVLYRNISRFLFDNLLDRDDSVEVVTLVQKGNTQALQNRCNVFNKFPRLFLVRYLFLDRQPGSPTPHQAEVNRMLGPVKILFSTQPSQKTSHISSHLQHLISKSATLRKYSTRETHASKISSSANIFKKASDLKPLCSYYRDHIPGISYWGGPRGGHQASVSKRGYVRSYWYENVFLFSSK